MVPHDSEPGRRGHDAASDEASATEAAGERALPEAAGGKRRLGAGDRLGRYTVLEEIGRGAMGLVFTAFDPALDRRVALKVVARSDDAVHRARLVREAQAMAKLSHRHVVAVHDVGEASIAGDGAGTDPPAVYIAMEFIRGGTLRAWLQSERSVAEIVRMFVGCARGLAAAHHAGLVHADFKPDNVLVDDEGLPRVADFGLVTYDRRAAYAEAHGTGKSPAWTPGDEATVPGGAQDGLLTAADAAIGTPAYMAPEIFAGRRADARGDQWALCVALYEGLFGERPFVAPTIVELAGVVRAGALRFPESRRVSSELRSILARGLSVEPADRWPSLDDLARALESTLAPPRSRRGQLVAAAVAVTATATVGVFAIDRREAPQCTAGADQIAEVWHPARRQALTDAVSASGQPFATSMTKSMLAEIDRRASAWAAELDDACAATRIRGEQSEALLDRRTTCLARRRHELDRWIDAVGAAGPVALERSLAGLESLPSPERCAEIEVAGGTHTPPEDPAKRAEYDATTEAIARIAATAAAGDRAAALAQAEPLVARAEQLDHPPTVAEALLLRASLRRDVGGPAAAEPAADDSFAALVLATRHDLGELEVRANLALAYDQIRRTDPARGHQYLRIADAGIERTGGDAELARQAARYEGFMLRVEGRFDDALVAHRREIALAERTPTRPLALAMALGSAADCEVRLRRTDDADALYRRAIAIQRALLGDDHPAVASTLSNMGLAQREAKHPELARPLLEQAVEIHRRTHGLAHPDAIDTIANLAIVRGDLGDEAGWIAGLEQALALRREVVPAGHEKRVVAHNDLGNAYFDVERLDDARAQYLAALDELDHGLGRGHMLAAFPLTGLAFVARAQGDRAAALDFHRQALRVRDATVGSDRGALLENLGPILELARELGDRELVASSRTEATAIVDALAPGDPRRQGWPERLAAVTEGAVSRATTP